jgi:hypothetical protein
VHSHLRGAAGGVSLLLWFCASEGYDVFLNMDVNTHLMFQLMRWMLPYLPLVCVAAGFIGMPECPQPLLHARVGGDHAQCGDARLRLVVGPAFRVRKLHDKVFALAVGVVVAGVDRRLSRCLRCSRRDSNSDG